MKKRIFALAVVVVCIAILATGTLAYYTAEDTAHNVITTGSIDIALVEKTIDESGATVDFPETGIHNVVPGTSVSKIVTVSNTGEGTAWIRVKVEAAIVSAEDVELPLTVTDANGSEVEVMTYTVEAESGWILGEDGYYYYTEPVASGASTTVLFDEVAFAPEMGNEYQNCTANLIVSAEAVQVANNGKTVTEAAGWPSESNE